MWLLCWPIVTVVEDRPNDRKILSPSSNLILLAIINPPCSAVSLQQLSYLYFFLLFISTLIGRPSWVFISCWSQVKRLQCTLLVLCSWNDNVVADSMHPESTFNIFASEHGGRHHMVQICVLNMSRPQVQYNSRFFTTRQQDQSSSEKSKHVKMCPCENPNLVTAPRLTQP